MLCKDMVKGDPHRSLGLGKSLSLRIGAVGHKRKYAFLSDLCKPLEINGIPEHRRIVYLEVSGMNNHSGRRIDCQCGCILNTVVCLNKLNPELTQIDRLTVLNNFALCAAQKIVFLQFIFDDSHGKFRRIDRKIDLF